MKMKTLKFIGTLLVGLVLLVTIVLAMRTGAPAIAASPNLQPTPVGPQAGGDNWAIINYDSSTTWPSAYDTVTSTSKHAPGYNVVDLTYTADISGTMKVTCTLEWSNDNTNWADGVDFVNALTADTTGITQTVLFARWHHVVCTETEGEVLNTTYTMTIIGKVMN